MPGHSRQVLRIQRQHALAHQDGEQQYQTQRIKQQNSQQVALPVHLFLTNAEHGPERALHAAHARQGFAVNQPGQQAAQRFRQRHQHQQETGDK
ncbi:Uncharacterised protein [Cronobacter sakazakii]|nr:Uncharacterised protein [Cronobacter sakazakii]